MILHQMFQVSFSYFIVIIMKSDRQSDSSEQEGFYKPVVNVFMEEEPSTPVVSGKEGEWEANNLVTHQRPTDYLPRTLTSLSNTYSLSPCCQSSKCSPQNVLVPLKLQKNKKCKYLSLQQKYQNNQTYKQIYSKLDQPQQFNSYIFSLKYTTDYNPKDYQPPLESQEEIPNSEGGKFQSRFQSGNLLLGYKCMQSKCEQYDLIIQNDTNTRGYNQWFFFSFKNQNSRTVRFNIVNMVKRHSLFEEGVLPVGMSTIDYKKGWQSMGRDVDYQKSYINRQMNSNPPVSKNYYTLSFTIDFQHTNDTIFLALNYPYTYSKMIKLITSLKSISKDVQINQQIITYSISNNPVPILKIRHKQWQEGGKRIIVMARQHPGETVSSYTFEGFIKKIIHEDKILRFYQVIAIPMVNPDGVIYGNFRTNLSGFDLNRQWQTPDRWLQPQIFSIKKYISKLQNIAFVLDFHGHSKKYNSFIFACSGQPLFPFRVYPYIFSKHSSLFSIKDCTYDLTPQKQRTARIQIFNQVNKPQIFTLETSFFGYEDEGKRYRWNIKKLESIGEAACQSLKVFCLKKKELANYQKEVREKQYLFEQWSKNMKRDDIESQSNPSEDELTIIERTQKVIESKSPKKRSKAKSKSKQKINKIPDSIVNLSKLKASIDDKQNLLFEDSWNQKRSVTGPVIIKKKMESQRQIVGDKKLKTKKTQKNIQITRTKYKAPPPPPKKTESNQFKTQEKTSHLQFLEQQLKLQKPPAKKQQKLQRSSSKKQGQSQNITSNLFNKPNFYNHFQKTRDTRTILYNKTQSLQVSNNKKNNTVQGANFDVLRKLIASQQEDSKQVKIESKKHKQRNYFIRENKSLSSANKIHEEAIKKNMEEQITNRTQALLNCQKKMNQITFTDNLMQLEPQPWEIPRQPYSTKPPKFPSIKQKKHDYFLF